MSSITPVWTDNTSVIAAATLAKGSVARGTIDLRTKYGAYLFIRLGMKGATQPGTAISVLCRRVLNNDGVDGRHPAAKVPLQGSTTAGNATTVAVDAALGATAITLASGTGFVAGDTVCIYDAAFVRLEFARVAKVVGAVITLDAPTSYAHTAAQADNVTRIADVFPELKVEGGSLWEVVIDYAAAATGSDYVVEVKAQSYDSDLIV